MTEKGEYINIIITTTKPNPSVPILTFKHLIVHMGRIVDMDFYEERIHLSGMPQINQSDRL
ncbi:MAG: hypothetical protein U9N82_08610 [Thermodesulfobacteriota bacterium]|nr:hypothetical protein [Thermodesulfobacteriota bacterium]